MCKYIKNPIPLIYQQGGGTIQPHALYAEATEYQLEASRTKRKKILFIINT